MAEVRVFHSHIEVYPYKEGDCPDVERMMSKYNTITHKRVPIGYYILNNILVNFEVLVLKYFHLLLSSVKTFHIY